MPKKTGVEPELGDGHEESLESTEAQNNLHTTEQKVHQNRGCNTQEVSRRFDDTGQMDAKKEKQPGTGGTQVPKKEQWQRQASAEVCVPIGSLYEQW